MKKVLALTIACFATAAIYAQSPVGKWKKISATTIYNGQKMEMHDALLKVRPCAANTVYEFTADGKSTLTVNGCDESYKKIQERMWAKTRWKIEGDKITTSVTDFALGNTYTISFSGNTMTWTDENGTTVYKKL